jgi:hypothetical protein
MMFAAECITALLLGAFALLILAILLGDVEW